MYRVIEYGRPGWKQEQLIGKIGKVSMCAGMVLIAGETLRRRRRK